MMSDDGEVAQFDVNKFEKSKFIPRTGYVDVPALSEWFSGDEDNAKWMVRGLTGHEVGYIREISTRERNIESVIQAIGSTSKQVDELKKAMGMTDDTPTDILKRLEQICIATVNVDITKKIAVKLCTNFPIEFYSITNKINQLTGLGSDVKK